MKFLTATAVALLLSSTAYAADAIYEDNVSIAVAPEVTPDTFSWTGGYIGVNAGFAGGKFKNPLALTDTETGDWIGGDLSNRTNGFVGGVQAGYNWQFGQAVVGVETDFNFAGLKGEYGVANIDEFAVQSSSITNKVDWFGTLRARLGYVPTERLMVYATGGAAYGHVKTTLDYSYDDGMFSFEDSTTEKKTRWGYTVGAGAEYAVTNNWTLKSEYLYTDLGKAKLYSAVDPDLGLGASLDTKAKFHTVRFGLNYKF